MRIVVLVKQVPDPEARVTVREGGGPDALSVEDRWLTSYFDEVALERALQLRERHGGTVTAVSAGPGRAVDALRRAVAFGADVYLVVWQDGRDATAPHIYGARVSTACAVLDAAGIAISPTTGVQYSPAVAFDGTNFLVVWGQSPFPELRPPFETLDILGARVTPAGAVLDATPIAISTAEYGQQFPAVAFGATSYLVVWQDWRNAAWWEEAYDSDVYAARVTPAGAVLDGAGIAVSTTMGFYESIPAVAFDGTNYLVVWQESWSERDYWDIYGTRVTPAGAVLDGAGIAVSTAVGSETAPAVTFDGRTSLVVWRDAAGAGDVRAARIETTGVVTDPAGLDVSSTAAGESAPGVAAGPTGRAIVVYETDSQGYGVPRVRARLFTSGCTVTTDCNDSNPCTDDSCHPASGCVFVDNTAPCDDGDPCTAGEACSAGACVDGVPVCECTTDEDCLSHEDGDLCNGTYRCVATFCETDPATVVTCDPSADTSCRRNVCDPASGTCSMSDLPNGTSCDDGDSCTADDTCAGGACSGAPIPGCPGDGDADADDGGEDAGRPEAVDEVLGDVIDVPADGAQVLRVAGGGCGCRAASRPSSFVGWALILGFVLARALRRHRGR
ncbi:MAG: MYXO-CTERM sorting domain-containing protein [Myxococcota bacterium]|nr:MYXO-CTERM sorting domain-containing protein [Myxococcota bacterium]